MPLIASHTLSPLSLFSAQELEAAECEYVLDEGPLHQGLGAVVRGVWRKLAS
jgi:hypothetical protein